MYHKLLQRECPSFRTLHEMNCPNMIIPFSCLSFFVEIEYICWLETVEVVSLLHLNTLFTAKF